jgi:UDP-3-O-[3-hydroxymyristoyl] glucosamine N-acyltransferase
MVNGLSFFPRRSPLNLADVCRLAEVALPDGHASDRCFEDIAPLASAGPQHVAFLDNPAYATEAGSSLAGICLVSPRLERHVSGASIKLVSREPYRAFARVAAALYPSSIKPSSVFNATGVSPGAMVHPEARLEPGVVVDPGAVIGPHAEIGSGTIIQPGAVVGPYVRIGRDCGIGAGATVLNALIGNRVILHGGVRVGQDGFGFAMSPQGHLKVPQIGRVIIQDDVEIGANTTIDRGATRDTVIGEGTKIDNLVQIAHNVSIGRHCVIVAQVGISGSSVLEDFVALGGQVGVIGHVRIGMGAQIAATSNVNSDVPPGARWGGTPAKPVREWFREVTALKNLAAKRGSDTE